MNLESEHVSFSFYKLLLYEKGGLFKPHRDTEKENGHFATMLILLPSIFTGGEVLLQQIIVSKKKIK